MSPKLKKRKCYHYYLQNVQEKWVLELCKLIKYEKKHWEMWIAAKATLRFYKHVPKVLKWTVKPGVQLSVSPNQAAPSWLGVLVGMALRAGETGSTRLAARPGPQPVAPLKWASTEPWWARSSHVEFAFMLAYNIFAPTSWANLNWLGTPQFGLALGCIPGLTRRQYAHELWWRLLIIVFIDKYR